MAVSNPANHRTAETPDAREVRTGAVVRTGVTPVSPRRRVSRFTPDTDRRKHVVVVVVVVVAAIVLVVALLFPLHRRSSTAQQTLRCGGAKYRPASLSLAADSPSLPFPPADHTCCPPPTLAPPILLGPDEVNRRAILLLPLALRRLQVTAPSTPPTSLSLVVLAATASAPTGLAPTSAGPRASRTTTTPPPPVATRGLSPQLTHARVFRAVWI